MKKSFTDEENGKLKATVKRLEEDIELLRSRNMELDAVSSRKLVRTFFVGSVVIRSSIQNVKFPSAINGIEVEPCPGTGIVLQK